MPDDKIKNRTVYMLCRTDGGNDIYIGSTSTPLENGFQAINIMQGTHPGSAGIQNYTKKCAKLVSTVGVWSR